MTLQEPSENGWNTEKILGVIAWVVILFIPTISTTEVLSGREYLETTYYWPWMVLSHLQPSETFLTDQYNYFSFPWSFVLFLPFLYGLKFAFDIFKGEDKIKNAGMLTITSLLQMGLIAITFRSQDPAVVENISVIYIPQLLILFLFGSFTGFWYYEKSKEMLESAARRKAEKIKEKEAEE